MIKMLEIRKAIINRIRNVQPEVYYQNATPDAIMPYVILDISNSTDDGTLERFIMDVDGWDRQASSVALETAMDSVDKLLHRWTTYITVQGKQLGISIYRENRLTFEESDKQTIRRRYIYQIRTHQN